jgi:5-methylthioadenosine/S-adenosylhomocysteine deaminase
MTPARAVIHDGAILVENDRIAFVGPRRDLPEIVGEHRRIDASGQVALPGLIDAHTHLGLTILKGYVEDMDFYDELAEVLHPSEAAMTAEEGYLSRLIGGLETMKAGATTILDLYHDGASTARAVEALGVRAELALMTLDFDLAQPRRVAQPPGGMHLDSRFGRAELDENIALARRDWGDRITWRVGVNTTDSVTDRTMIDAVQLAHDHGLGMHMHVSQSPWEVEYSHAHRGCSPVEYLRRIGGLDLNLAAAHATALSDSDLAILADSSAFIAHCPISNAKGGPVAARIPEFLELGGAVALGTDAAPSDMLEVVRHSSVVHKLVTRSVRTMSAWQSLELATISGARAIGRDDEIGSLEVGKLADLILIDLDQPHLQPAVDLVGTLVYNARGSDVTTVIVGGEVIVEAGRSTRIDESAMLARFTEVAWDFWHRRKLAVASA